MKPIIPMEPMTGDAIPCGDDWLAQIKWDGVRILTYYDGDEVRLFNRKGNERTQHFPELTPIQSYCKASSIILDGEVIALGPNGKPSFHEVMRRDGIRRLEKVYRAQQTTPIYYMIFDLLYLDGKWIHSLPLRKRLEILQETIVENAHIQLVTSHSDGDALFTVIKQQGMEGIVVKKSDSPYLIGEKKDYWRKVKNYRDLIAVIGGFTASGGIVNAVLLGLYDDQQQLVYIGHTGTGKLTRQEWRELTDRLVPLVVRERPFVNKPDRHSDAYWVKPVLTAKIKFAEWTEGHSLRQPSIQGFVDVTPLECRLDAELMR